MALRVPALVLVLVLGAGRAAAGQGGGWETVREELGDAARDLVHVWVAPFRLGGDDLASLVILGEAFAIAALNDEAIRAWVEGNGHTPAVKAIRLFEEPRRVHRLGLTRHLIGLSAGLYVAGLATGSGDLREAGLGCAVSNLATTIPRSIVARTVGRLRPRYRRGAFVFEPWVGWRSWAYRSFPVGHGANSMACAAFLVERFDLGVAEPAVYLLATGIGLARVTKGAHWASDAVAGLAWGWAVGRGVGGRFLERAEAEGTLAGQAAEAHAAPRLYVGLRVEF
ncbi:MAG TPA: phosphatase PAP2 family protein [Longimicrobiales bacterium]